MENDVKRIALIIIALTLCLVTSLVFNYYQHRTLAANETLTPTNEAKAFAEGQQDAAAKIQEQLKNINISRNDKGQLICSNK